MNDTASQGTPASDPITTAIAEHESAWGAWREALDAHQGQLEALRDLDPGYSYDLPDVPELIARFSPPAEAAERIASWERDAAQLDVVDREEARTLQALLKVLETIERPTESGLAAFAKHARSYDLIEDGVPVGRLTRQGLAALSRRVLLMAA